MTEIVSAFQSADNDINNAITILSNNGTSGLSAEISRATAAEASIAANLSTEIVNRGLDVDAEEARAMSVEAVISQDLSLETANRQAAVSTEIARATAAENSIASNLTSEIANRIADVDAEESRAMSVEGFLMTKINNEISDRTADVDAEESRAMAAETSIASNLSTEIANRIADVDAEESRAVSAEASLTEKVDIQSTWINNVIETFDNMISAEVSRATGAEASLETALSTEVAYLISNTDLTAIDSFAEVSTEIANITNDFNNTYFKKVSVSGLVDGSNKNFTLGATVRFDSEAIYLNGVLQEKGEDYNITGGVNVVFTFTPSKGKVTAYGVYA